MTDITVYQRPSVINVACVTIYVTWCYEQKYQQEHSGLLRRNGSVKIFLSDLCCRIFCNGNILNIFRKTSSQLFTQSRPGSSNLLCHILKEMRARSDRRNLNHLAHLQPLCILSDPCVNAGHPWLAALSSDTPTHDHPCQHIGHVLDSKGPSWKAALWSFLPGFEMGVLTGISIAGACPGLSIPRAKLVLSNVDDGRPISFSKSPFLVQKLALVLKPLPALRILHHLHFRVHQLLCGERQWMMRDRYWTLYLTRFPLLHVLHRSVPDPKKKLRLPSPYPLTPIQQVLPGPARSCCPECQEDKPEKPFSSSWRSWKGSAPRGHCRFQGICSQDGV